MCVWVCAVQSVSIGEEFSVQHIPSVMKSTLVSILLIVLHAPACKTCKTCSILVAGACCLAKPPNCCPNKPGECPTNDFGSRDGPLPLIPFPYANVITCSSDQNCSGNAKCCPMRQNSTGIIFYTCQEPFTEFTLGVGRLATGCPAQFGAFGNQFGGYGNQPGIINIG